MRWTLELCGKTLKLIVFGRIVVNSCPLGAPARLGLARPYAVQNDRGKARAAYEDFFTLWKDADPGIPILKEAKVEYRTLQ